MRYLFGILSVLVFVWIGGIQAKNANYAQNPDGILITKNIPAGQHAIFLENNLSGTPDSDELDSIESVSILPETFYDFQQFVIKRISDDSSTLKPNLSCELLLDLPPPIISV